MGSCVSSYENEMKPGETPNEYMVRRQYARLVAMNDKERSMYLLHLNTYG
jgi:hypothetical protein